MESIFSPPQASFARLARSPFRARFHLKARDWAYAKALGPERLALHARRFVRERLAPACPANDGSQTPMRGHPVFVAQHACACCCRGCLAKWYGVPENAELDSRTCEAIAELLLAWIARELERTPERPRSRPGEPDLFG